MRKVRKKFVWRAHRGAVYDLVAHPSRAGYFYSCGGDGRLVAWASEERAPRWEVSLRGPLYAMAYVPTLDCLVVGSNREGLFFYDAQEGRLLGSSPVPDEFFYGLCAHGAHVMAAQKGGGLRFVSLASKKTEKVLALSSERLRCLCINPRANECLVAGGDAVIRVLDLDSLRVKQSLRAHEKSIFSLCFTPNYLYLFSAGMDAKINIWFRGGSGVYTLHRELRGHRGTVNGVVVDETGDHFLSGSMDRSLKLWRTDSLSLLEVVDTMRHSYHSRSVNGLCWLPGRPGQFLSCSDDRHIVLWAHREA